MLDEFLSLKYQGVRTPWEILKSPTSIGWKCRKYIKWDQVQAGRGDKVILKEFADALIDDERLETKHLGAINRIFEKVQRWRLDSENLSVEPELRAGYDALRRSFNVATENPQVIEAILVRSGWLGDRTDVVGFRALFLLHEIADFLQSLPGSPTLSTTKPVASLSQSEVETLTRGAIRDVYRDFGLEPLAKDARSLTDQFLADLDLSFDIDTSSVRRSIEEGALAEVPQVVVEFTEIGNESLITIKFIKGQLVILVNAHHSWFRKAGISPDELRRHKASLFLSIGEAALDMLGSKDELNHYFAYLGLNLARHSRVADMTLSAPQHTQRGEKKRVKDA